MKLSLHQYEKISLLSGFLITFVFGSLYTLGTITPYIASYIHYSDDPNIYAVDVSILYPTYMVSQVVGIVLSMYFLLISRNFLQKFIGFKLLCFIGVYGMVVCVFITSFVQSFAAYVFFYGVLFGFLVGFCYLIPVLNCYQYLPNKKGLVLYQISRSLFRSLHDGFWPWITSFQLYSAGTDKSKRLRTKRATSFSSWCCCQRSKRLKIHQHCIFFNRNSWMLTDDSEM